MERENADNVCSGYIYKGHKKLRCGYTTGTCAAAAAKAAVRLLLTGVPLTHISITTPNGVTLELPVHDLTLSDSRASCAVRKDAGDDADLTDGISIYASAVLTPDSADIVIEGGIGIGRITRPGLEQPVGSAAINRVPRRMIRQAALAELRRAGSAAGAKITIYAPEGEKIAEKTFNPQLGITGGISILGTSGIVEPMSEQALLETIRLEIRQKKLLGEKLLLISPGNYGQAFTRASLHIDLAHSVKCSNFIGDTLDMALEAGFTQLLLVGHIGKLVKVASGIMNTHSKMADARLETLCSCALLAGADGCLARRILGCATTDDALSLLRGCGLLSPAMDILTDRIRYHMRRRTENRIQIETVLFSNQYGLLAQSDGAQGMIDTLLSDRKESI